MPHHHSHEIDTPRDPRSDAPVIVMDLSRNDDAIHRDLRARWPQDPFMWWELDPSEQTGWVYSRSNRILARIVQAVRVRP
jgi:hypothetical protein